MRIVVLGAGHVGQAIVAALYADHDVTVIDIDSRVLAGLASRYDVRTVEGDGTTKRVVREAGVEQAELFIGCSDREEANLICALLVKRLSSAKTVIRTTSSAYLDAWRERQIEVDYMISPEIETATAIAGLLGIPSARHADSFADGRVQIVEFAVPLDGGDAGLIGRPLREANVPDDSRVAGLIRAGEMVVPSGEEAIQPGDRVVVIGTPEAAHAWSRIITHGARAADDVVIFGCGRMGTAIGAALLERGVRLRAVDGRRERAEEVAQELPGVRAFHAHAFDPEFLERERIGRATAAVFCLNDDAKNLYGAVLAKLHGVALTIALVHDEVSVEIYEHGGVDVAINPRELTAEEMARFAHDPRLRQISMLEHDRFEILDLSVRAESRLAGRALRDLPATGSRIGALVRGDSIVFPRGTEVLEAGDRVIVFVESKRASEVEAAL
jgi:trk system potassium uptake protein